MVVPTCFSDTTISQFRSFLFPSCFNPLLILYPKAWTLRLENSKPNFLHLFSTDSERHISASQQCSQLLSIAISDIAKLCIRP